MEEEETNYELLYKVIIIGDTNVGKSNILTRYLKDEFSSNTRSAVLPLIRVIKSSGLNSI